MINLNEDISRYLSVNHVDNFPDFFGYLRHDGFRTEL